MNFLKAKWKRFWLMVLCICIVAALPVSVSAATVTINRSSANLAVGQSIKLKIWGTAKKVSWSSNKRTVATVTSSGIVKAKAKGSAIITAKVRGSSKKYRCRIVVGKVPRITYQAHVEEAGWQRSVTTVDAVSRNASGATAGTTGQAKRLEALKIVLTDTNGKSMITYRAHVSDVGWQAWKKSGQTAGTTGQSKAIEAVQIKLTGTYAKSYDIYYRMHVANKGWLGWTKNGGTAGTTGLSLRSEAIQIKIVKKGTSVSKNGTASLSRPALSYMSHVEGIGWQKKVNENTVSGTTGNAKRLEALQIVLKDFDGKSGITYRAHVSGVGWQGWKSSGVTAGTTGQAKAIEAVQIKLSSSLSDYFDVYYRMHVEGKGWLGWAKNGAMAGTTGGGIRAEAIQIKLAAKGSTVSTDGTAYVNASVNVSGSFKYNWKLRGGTDVTDEFLAKTAEISAKLRVSPDDLMTVMAFESGLNHKRVNSVSGATGLIQFMPSTAKNLGVSTAQLASMSAVRQLDYVYSYLKQYSGISTLGDLYMSILWPRGIGKTNSYILWQKGSVQYSQNSGLDSNRDGKITKAEAVQKVLSARRYYVGA